MDGHNWPNLALIFQSTLPLRGATAGIHGVQHDLRHFNPRSPYGERQPVGSRLRMMRYFNPRSPYGERLAACLIYAAT